MPWLDRLIIELAHTCREALGSWHRTGRFCLVVLVTALSLSLVLWTAHK